MWCVCGGESMFEYIAHVCNRAQVFTRTHLMRETVTAKYELYALLV